MNKHLTYDEYFDTYCKPTLIYKNYFEQIKEIDRLQQKLQRKDNDWNELKKWLNEPQITYNLDASEFGIEKIECVSVKDTLNKIKELESK